ncbi:MAG: S-methyl-5-thioribose kinase [Bacillota bacterium]|nr:S-methyl-5-thioribose kinase [Bacillota bacterium]
MSRFKSKYFTMEEADALEYAAAELDFFSKEAELSCSEIGDGNLNYVFKIADAKTGKSLIIKQAGPCARIDETIKVSPDRNRIESDILKIQYELSEGLVPELYKYDEIMNCCVMEDLSDYTILRKALIEHKKFPHFAEQITDFLVKTLLLTSDVVINHKGKKDLVKNFINPELCEITEDLVYTEPFFNCNRNDVFEPTRPFAEKEFWNNEELLLETAKLKFEFLTNAQALLHGDLHTGSIFVKEDSIKVIDPEFAFFGPAGYDIGNVIANLIFAYENAEAAIEDKASKEDYKNYLEATIVKIIDLFIQKFNKTYDEKVRERVATYKGFKEYYLDSIIRDTSAVTGLELVRRILGMAHVKDITGIEDIDKRARAEKICLLAGKNFILNRKEIKTGKDFIQVVRNAESSI